MKLSDQQALMLLRILEDTLSLEEPRFFYKKNFRLELYGKILSQQDKTPNELFERTSEPKQAAIAARSLKTNIKTAGMIKDDILRFKLEGMNQKDISKKVGKSQSYVSVVLKQLSKAPIIDDESIKSLEKAAREFVEKKKNKKQFYKVGS